MTKKQRIEAMEKRIAELEARIVMLEAKGTLPYWVPTYVPDPAPKPVPILDWPKWDWTTTTKPTDITPIVRWQS